MDVYIRLITFFACFTLIQTQICKREQRCRISRIHHMKSANCYDRKITQFPQCLPEDVEIIDLSFNRIRKLKKDDLSRYSDIKILYLNDNAIISIDEEIFEGMDDLTTLDLSLNSISKLPAMVFQLPSLKSLYLGQNLNMNIVEVVESAKPVTSPLIQLDISYVMSEEANQLPEFGILPFLTKYVIAENKLKNVTTKQFAGLCSLDKLNTTNVSIEFADPCDCWQINKWLKKRKVQFTLFECEIDRNECLNDIPNEDMKIYEKCLEKRETYLQKNRILKIAIPISVTFVIFIIVVIFIVRRKRKQKQRKDGPEKTLNAGEPLFNKSVN